MSCARCTSSSSRPRDTPACRVRPSQQNDPSLLLINSGMAPMKPFFTGEQEPPRHRVTTCQKCIRTGDIENVGKTARHGTFFEMLGTSFMITASARPFTGAGDS